MSRHLKLADHVRKECVLAGAEISDKAEALRTIANLAKLSPILADISAEEIRQGLQEREALGSTGLGNGVALPHCRLESVTEFVVGMITVPTAIDFEAEDGKNVGLMVFVIGPQRAPGRHLRVLAAISQAMMPHKTLDTFLECTSPEALRDRFLENVDPEIAPPGASGLSGIFVIVQDETVLGDLVHAMVPLTHGTLLALDAEPAEAYLVRIPLFASLVEDAARSFGKILFAIVDGGQVSGILRAIERVTGDLGKRTGVMVAVQDYALVAGSLELPD